MRRWYTSPWKDHEVLRNKKLKLMFSFCCLVPTEWWLITGTFLYNPVTIHQFPWFLHWKNCKNCNCTVFAWFQKQMVQITVWRLLIEFIHREMCSPSVLFSYNPWTLICSCHRFCQIIVNQCAWSSWSVMLHQALMQHHYWKNTDDLTMDEIHR